MANLNQLERDIHSIHAQLAAITAALNIPVVTVSSERQKAEDAGRKAWQPGGVRYVEMY